MPVPCSGSGGARASKGSCKVGGGKRRGGRGRTRVGGGGGSGPPGDWAGAALPKKMEKTEGGHALARRPRFRGRGGLRAGVARIKGSSCCALGGSVGRFVLSLSGSGARVEGGKGMAPALARRALCGSFGFVLFFVLGAPLREGVPGGVGGRERGCALTTTRSCFKASRSLCCQLGFFGCVFPALVVGRARAREGPEEGGGLGGGRTKRVPPF